jgi:hypothetical protein
MGVDFENIVEWIFDVDHFIRLIVRGSACGADRQKAYNEVPLKVEYSISEKGPTLKPLLEEMHRWGKKQWHAE